MSYAEQQGRLSPKQHKFVQAILKGETITKAYEKAGYSGTSNNGTRMTKKAEVRKAIEAAKAEAATRTVKTVETLVRDLDEIRILAIQDGQYAAAAACVMGQGKLLGLMIDRKEINMLHRPAPIPTSVIELDEDEWKRQFALPEPVDPNELRDAVEEAGLNPDEIPDFMRR